MSAILAVAAASKVGKDVTSLLIKQMFTEAMTTETIQMLLEDPNALIGAFDSPAVVRKFFSSTAFQTVFFQQASAYRIRAISKLIGVEATGPYDNMAQVGGDYRAIAAMVGLKPADYTSWSNMVSVPAALAAILGVSPTLVTFSTLAMNVIAASASAVTQIAATAEGRTLLLTNATLIAGIQANAASLAALNAALLSANTTADWSTWVANAGVFDPVLADTNRFTGLMALPPFDTALAQNSVAMVKVAAVPTVIGWAFNDAPAMDILASFQPARTAMLSNAVAMAAITDMALGKLIIGNLGRTDISPSEVVSWTAVFADKVLFGAVTGSTPAMAAVAASSTAMAAVAASSTAMAAVAASSTAMAAVIASSTAMAAVIASSTAMAAVAASSTAMAAVIASSTAMAAVAASSTAMAAVIASSTAMAAVAASSTAMAAVICSENAMRRILANNAAGLSFWGAWTMGTNQASKDFGAVKRDTLVVEWMSRASYTFVVTAGGAVRLSAASPGMTIITSRITLGVNLGVLDFAQSYIAAGQAFPVYYNGNTYLQLQRSTGTITAPTSDAFIKTFWLE